MGDCFLYWTRILVIAEVITYHIDIWLRCIIPFIEIIFCTCIDMRLSISCARGDRPCEICLIYVSALRSSAQTRGDYPCRYMDLASPPWVMNSRCISEEYHVYTVERVLGILRHIISWCHIALHPMTSFILDDLCLFGGWKVLDIWLPLFDELDLVCCWYYECLFVKVVQDMKLLLLLRICNWLKWLLLSWVLCTWCTVRLGWFYTDCSCEGSVGV